MRGERFLPDHVITERAARMRLSGMWSICEIAQELGCSRRTVYRALPPEVRRGTVWVYTDESRERLRASFQRWHEAMKREGLPRNGSMTIRGGRVVRTGRVDPWK